MTETQLVSYMERAAVHQLRALAYLRDVRNPYDTLDALQARARLMCALEHAMRARSLLQQARDGVERPDLTDELDRHLARLDGVESAVARWLQELGDTLDESPC